MAGLTLDPIPQTDPLVDQSGRMGERWYRWLSLIVSRMQSAILGVASVHRTGIGASISATTIYTPNQDKVFRVSWYARITTAATTSSSLTVTISWTDNGVSCSKSFTALTGNTTATADGDSVTMRPQSGQPVKYATTYASVGGTPMAHQLDVTVEQVT